MGTHESLMLFCGDESANDKYDFRYPFTLDGWTYATDARIAVRVPAVQGVELGSKESRHPIDIVRFPQWDEFPLASPLPLPVLPPKTEYRCDQCEGEGFFAKCICTADDCHLCGICEGLGELFADQWRALGCPPTTTGQCNECRGAAVTPMPHITINNLICADHYLRKIDRIGQVVVQTGTTHDRLLFASGKLQGLLATLRDRQNGDAT